ncbi:DUF167 family protein [Pokkaliibacter sp. MBI-7]|uniref:DUF167 family protein n=1 Tax=Pokkaliibacter sp. MBI-7 TaxID=3040600 RepID=UPI002448FBAE|nr:DUF167 family protein [Pokkaliibacter sp. MBI-7]MDH2432874.1 DUF167 family protein [Pokkaliibacter sp. MBI-7]
MSFFEWRGQDLLLVCHLQPKASKDEIVGLHGDALKIRITAPPVEGKANSHLVRFLASAFAVTRKDVEIVSGELNRHKRVCIHGPLTVPAVIESMMRS